MTSRTQQYCLRKALRQTFKLSLATTCLLFIAGCETAGYYSQAIKGHIQLYRGREPITRALEDQRLNPIERERLALVPKIMAFAKTQLHLPSKDQYDTLVFMNRQAVTWNVFAAPTDSLNPKTWCFPIVGCVSYRGYFAKADALNYAEKIGRQGWETYVGGAAAYSTLGWFEDPILSTFLKRDTPNFIGLLFHELAHQQLYIKDDTTFNESFAKTIEQAGVIAWYAKHPDEEALAHYLDQFERRTEFLTLAMSTKEALRSLYTQNLPTSQLQIEKQKILAQFRQHYTERVSTRWQGKKPYDGWMQGPLNNAQWNTLGTYYDLVPAFSNLLKHLNYDFEQFYATCKALGALEKSQRHQLLSKCHANSCSDITHL